MRLDKYLKIKKWSKRSFANMARISPHTVDRIIEGGDIMLSTAVIIEAMTGGKVEIKDMVDPEVYKTIAKYLEEDKKKLEE